MLHERRQRAAAALGLWLVMLVVAAFFGHGVSAQSDGLTVQITAMTGDDWPQAGVIASVLGEDGRTVPGLTADGFRAAIDGQDVPVEAVAQGVNSDQPIDVVLVLDVSGSMEGEALAQAKAAALSFLDQLGAGDQLAIITFGSTVDTVLPFTTDRAAAQSAIDGLEARGSTALFQATDESVRLATSGESGRRAIVLLSDGVDHGSPVSFDEAIAAAQQGGVPTFAIGLGNEIDRAYLRELTEETGGQFAETPSPEGLAALYQEVGELLRGQYILTLDASALNIERSQPATLLLEATQGDVAGSDERAVCAQNVCAAVAGILEGERLEGQSRVEAQVVSAEPVTSVTLIIDGEIVETLDVPPYEFSIDAETLTDGEHTLAIEATTETDSVTSAAIAVSVGAAASSGGGLTSGILPIAAAGAAAVVALLLVLFMLRRRRGGEAAPSPETPGPAPEPPPGAGVQPQRKAGGKLWAEDGPPAQRPAPQSALGTLTATRGEIAGQEFSISGTPISIGTGYRCIVRVPDEGDDVATEHCRVWVREDHLVVHELRRLTAFGPAGGRWEFLSAGETFSIGSNVFEFKLVDETSPEAAPPATVPEGALPTSATAPPPVAPSGAQPARAESTTHIPTVRSEPAADSPLAQPQAWPHDPEVPEFKREQQTQPPAETAELPPGVPNILRERPPAAAEPPPAASEVPAPSDDVPNILRDRPAPQEGEAEREKPASDGPPPKNDETAA